MGRRILIIDGHPDPEGGHLCHALVAAYRAGAEAAGHAVRQVDAARLDVPFVRSQEEWRLPTRQPVVAQAQADMVWAEHVVLVFPLWLGDMPAAMKHGLEHLSSGGAMIERDAAGRWHKKLSGRSARMIVTMGMPALIYRLFYFSHALRSLRRNILGFSGLSPVRESLFGNVEGPDRAAARARWIADVRHLGETAG
ncbi:NAD(P)H-dependent oxidoreductase [Aquabacter spiritensis]|uniref:Putative NADPH-quinone reductase n=1 Tax=Aquabacter spiritensis TaxID=933073 RepID=A0A4R3M0R7_9HYPH|nr:NAD(P)H-dependent oxidoreductase [Aquabacter spiritensis]TCT06186.1 putative NADPH-quinone reductase [Aquabacter spiritensis]